MSETLYCPFCGSDQIVEYTTGLSEFPLSCEPCGASFAIDREAGLVRTRRWDRLAAKGVHTEVPLAEMRRPPELPGE